MTSDIADMRISYELGHLGDKEILADPIAQFQLWFDEVRATDVIEANAFVLATVDESGSPDARTVLMKHMDARGITFYTNLESRKSEELAYQPDVCALFYWPSRERQVRWRGTATRLTDQENDAYFATRPRGSQLGAWASPQSSSIPGDQWLREQYDAVTERFSGMDNVPRPPHWGGYCIQPTSIEFWQGRANRLHDRIRYTRDGDTWRIERLAP